MPSNQQKIIEQAKFTYSPLGKAFEKQAKTIKDQGEKQADPLEALKTNELKPKDAKPIEYDNYFINRLAETRDSSKPIDYDNLTCNFKGPNISPINLIEFKGTLNIFESIYDGNRSLEDVEKDQIRLKSDVGHIKQGNPNDKLEGQFKVIDNVTNLYELIKKVVQMYNNCAKNMSKNIYESKQGTRLKILTPKQMLQRLPIALAEAKAGNNSESLLNEIRQIVYSLYQSKEITKKVYNDIIKSIKVSYKIDTIFINSENSRTSEYHVLIVKLNDKLDLRRGQKSIALSNLTIYYTWKNIKNLIQ